MEPEPPAPDHCKLCLRVCDDYENAAVCCEGDCQQKVHVRCLSRGALPTNLIGDVFFDLCCSSCSESNEEVVTRQKLSWLAAVILTLYNLREKSRGISRRGYFHWKSDISVFISNNWDQLFTKNVKRKKNWIGTISGTLSHYNGIFFKSGTTELGDQGWWKLIDNDPPQVLVNKYYKVLELKKQQQAKLKTKSSDIVRLLSDTHCQDQSSARLAVDRVYSEEAKPAQSTEYQQTGSSTLLPESMPGCEEFGDILDLDIDIPNIEDDFPAFNLTESAIVEELPFEACDQLQESLVSDCFDGMPDFMYEPEEDIDVSEVTISGNDVQEMEVAAVAAVAAVAPEDHEEDDDDGEGEAEADEEDKVLLRVDCDEDKGDDERPKYRDECIDARNELPPPVPSLFTQKVPRPWPWDESIKLDPDKVRPLMSEREEEFLLQKIEQYKHLLDTAPPSVRRLYRKLACRKLKRQYGLPLLNIDDLGKDGNYGSGGGGGGVGGVGSGGSRVRRKGNSVLDRFISEDMSVFFEQRLQGHCEPTSVHSPYTNRLLKPFIRRDTSSRPLWINVMAELLARVNKNKPGWRPRPVAPIDYSYIRPQHIPAINCLCRHFFWPGIDLTECLQYPDFTCVVLYRKLVIGFAIMVPDVGYNEAYISFLLVRPEWQKAGIGTFMLYHLVQTCMGKDITLHVSATNPALILYQKFGFKQEEFVQDFYDKYIPPSSNESKHALFLRLGR